MYAIADFSRNYTYLLEGGVYFFQGQFRGVYFFRVDLGGLYFFSLGRRWESSDPGLDKNCTLR